VTPGETERTDLRCVAFETIIPHWLQSSTEGISTHLSAAGYDTKPLLRLLQATAAAQDAVHAAGWDAATTAAFAQQLQALGLALNTFAISSACNHPGCVDVAGLSKKQLVNGAANACAGCRVARYCSKACQAKHWKQHKPVCKALAAASAAEHAGEAHTAQCAHAPA